MKKQLLVLSLCSSLALSGCAGMNDANTTRAQGAGVGAVTGTIFGGLVGYVTGGDTKSTVTGAALGLAAGAGAGLALGDHVANQKARYASQEDWLNSCIASAEKTNAETKALNKQLSREIATLKKKSRRLKKRYRAGQATKADMVVMKSRIDRNNAQAREALKKAQFELENQLSVAAQIKKGDAPVQGKALDKRITSLKKSINELEKKTQALASLSATMGV